MAQDKQVQVVVTVPKAKGRALNTVVDRLRDVGLDVEKVHEKLGLVTGSIDADKVSSLTEVEGVSFARPQRDTRLTSPEGR